MKLGFYRFTSGVKKLFKRSGSTENRDLPALKAGVRRVKKETEASLVFYFKSYKENIKFQYFFKLIESISEEMRFQMVNRFSGYQADLLQLKRLADENRDARGSTISAIDDVQSRLVAVKEKMEKVRDSL